MLVSKIKYISDNPIRRKTSDEKEVYHGAFGELDVAFNVLFIENENEKKYFESEIKALTQCENYQSNVQYVFNQKFSPCL